MYRQQLLKTRTTKYLPKFRIFLFWNKLYMQHTFSSCFIRYANMKWIRQVLLKIQSRHNFYHRWKGGQGEISIPPFKFVEVGGIMTFEISWYHSPLKVNTLIKSFVGPTWGPPGANRTQLGPMLTLWIYELKPCYLGSLKVTKPKGL